MIFLATAAHKLSLSLIVLSHTNHECRDTLALMTKSNVIGVNRLRYIRLIIKYHTNSLSLSLSNADGNYVRGCQGIYSQGVYFPPFQNGGRESDLILSFEFLNSNTPRPSTVDRLLPLVAIITPT